MSKTNDYLSSLSKGEVRALFIERLLNNCSYIIKKLNNENDEDVKDKQLFRQMIDECTIKNKTYEEIILAMTSKEFNTVKDIIIALGYDVTPYVTLENMLLILHNLG